MPGYFRTGLLQFLSMCYPHSHHSRNSDSPAVWMGTLTPLWKDLPSWFLKVPKHSLLSPLTLTFWLPFTTVLGKQPDCTHSNLSPMSHDCRLALITHTLTVCVHAPCPWGLRVFYPHQDTCSPLAACLASEPKFQGSKPWTHRSTPSCKAAKQTSLSNWQQEKAVFGVRTTVCSTHSCHLWSWSH